MSMGKDGTGCRRGPENMHIPTVSGRLAAWWYKVYEEIANGLVTNYETVLAGDEVD
jgi:hypothetical protein